MSKRTVDPNDPTTFRSGTVTDKQFVKEVPAPALLRMLSEAFPEIAGETDGPILIQIGGTNIHLETDVRIALVYQSREGEIINSPEVARSPGAVGANQEMTYPKKTGRSMLPPNLRSIPDLPEGVDNIQELLSNQPVAKTIRDN